MAEKPLIDSRIGAYHIVEELGQGGNAIVYLARDEKLDRMVALKMMHAFAYHPYRQRIIDRFRRGAQAAARLNHPNILPIYDFGEWQGTFYIVMQCVQGQTLRQHLLDNTDKIRPVAPLPLSEALHITQQVGAALDHAHRHNVVHRDVKPSNILLADDGRIYLTDFGLAHVEDAAPITISGETLGTPHYMSPEQGQGLPIDHRSDIYSLGVVLFQMLTGHVPFDADTPAPVILKHVVDPLPSPRSFNPDIPLMIEAVLRKALSKNPSDRYQTVDEFIQDLLAASGEEAQPPPSPVPAPVIAPPRPISLSQTLPERQPVAPPPSRITGHDNGSRWAIIGILAGVFLALVACGGLAYVLLGASDRRKEATPTVTQLAVATTPTPTLATPTATAGRPSITPEPTPTPIIVVENTATATHTLPTPTAAPSHTPTPTFSPAPTPTPTDTATVTATPTASPTPPPALPAGMVRIPAGEFIQGSSEAEIDAAIQLCANAYNGTCPHPREWFTDETPRRTVYLDAFLIDKWEVSNQQFTAFVIATGYQTDAEKRGESQTWRTFNTPDRESFPVIWTSWNDADAYCRWAGKRLPTEAEWEKAARGTDGRIWPWGNSWQSGRANTGDGGAGSIVAVGSYPTSASPYGVMDTTGNVWEWVADWYDPLWYGKSPANNPGGPLSGVSRVLRGGAFGNPPWEVRAAHRHSGGPDGYAPDHGFRCAR
ncbi:MAG: SUMF1/EgtB/PvdO family nonheme iron enzyme [Chloroflexota bacterium]